MWLTQEVSHGDADAQKVERNVDGQVIPFNVSQKGQMKIFGITLRYVYVRQNGVRTPDQLGLSGSNISWKSHDGIHREKAAKINDSFGWKISSYD